MYNLTVRTAEPLLDDVEAQDIGFIPWFPLAAGPLAAPDGPLAAPRRPARTPPHRSWRWPGCSSAHR